MFCGYFIYKRKKMLFYFALFSIYTIFAAKLRRLAALEFMNKTIRLFSHPLYVMAKPVGASCNMKCDYCYYQKETMQRMDYETLALFTQQYIEAQTMREVLFTWHGGEPLLRGKDFYREALRLQEKYRGGHIVDNCIQTNGTLIDGEWCEMFHDNGWLVGLSIDGTQEMHDAHRRFRNGGGSHERVLRAIDILDRHGVEWNAMAVVNSSNVGKPREFYHFFKQIGCRYIQFTPIVERTIGGRLASISDNPTQCTLTSESIMPEQWGDFLCGVFDEWVKQDVGEYFVQTFEATLANLCGVAPGICSMSRTCGSALVMEANGDIYSCDHFVFPEYRIGNIHEEPLVALAYSAQQSSFARLKTALSEDCRGCEYLRLCNGECPKNRFLHGNNYLCKGYKQFFGHSMEFFREFAKGL